jgi:hypothetical protein
MEEEMTQETPESGENPLSFKTVPDRTQIERVQPALDTGGPHLAFEAAPRAPLAPVTTPDPRTLRPSPLAPPALPVPKPPAYEEPSGSTSPAFEAVPASVAVVQQRPPTPTIGIRPEVGVPTGPVTPGGSGWNIRPMDEMVGQRRTKSDTPPTWKTRSLQSRDRSAWMVPDALRTRTISRRMVMGILLSIVLVAVLGFAGYQWLSGRAHPAHTITTPATVGTLTAIDTPAAVAVSQQMQKVMQQYGATNVVSGVYGTAGRATLVVLLAQGSAIESSTNQFFNDFTTGLKTQGVTVVNGETLNTNTGGSNFICSPATGPAPLTAVSLCGWDDGDTIGLVMDVSGQTVSATLQEAVAARTAGEH